MAPVARLWLTLSMVLLALGIAGCSDVDPRLDLSVPVGADYPCGPYMGRSFGVRSDHFLAWTPDSSRVVFIHGTVIWVVDAEGTKLHRIVDANPEPGYSGHPLLFGFHADVSSDGTRIAFTTCEYLVEPRLKHRLYSLREEYHYEIAAINLDGTGQQRLTANQDLDHYPMWSPDGSRVAFIGERIDEESRRLKDGLYTMAADGSDVREVLPPSSKGLSAAYPPMWLPDGETLAFLGYEGETQPMRHIYTIRADGTQLSRLVAGPLSLPAWSPDLDRFAVAKFSGENGEWVAIFTLAADGSDPIELTKITDRETFERSDGIYGYRIRTLSWSPDGTQILFSCDSAICVVDVEDGQVRGLVDTATNRIRPPYFAARSPAAAWSPDSSRIAVYISGNSRYGVPPQLYTVARDGTDRRDLIALDDDGKLAPANPPQETP